MQEEGAPDRDAEVANLATRLDAVEKHEEATQRSIKSEKEARVQLAAQVAEVGGSDAAVSQRLDAAENALKKLQVCLATSHSRRQPPAIAPRVPCASLPAHPAGRRARLWPESATAYW